MEEKNSPKPGHILFAENGKLLRRAFTHFLVQMPDGRVKSYLASGVEIILCTGIADRPLQWICPPKGTASKTDAARRVMMTDRDVAFYFAGLGSAVLALVGTLLF
jgi:hypothetical protein